ncbi:rhamnogalacturonan acetylesterase [Colwellia sp. 1_MG-2023]|uniref:rhamnogalacturonan acetylesterase n=1 Tax=Colwellia sp. 1_MG-2023 TaxID=3062649 RepID=UPI0026E263A1|nr:rhamnogalacturonan acetylesterase [Colwellia sp. 1_MG-2023]MDO6446400.1 rhamnogalacturonan acetylesterase [Colwellia sp. 1_MG-2023]
MKNIVMIYGILCLFAVSKVAKSAEVMTKIFMAGDSTMSIKHVKDYPEMGWGVPFSYFFDETVTVENRAENGRSTKTFISDGLWQGIIEELSPGDHVIIQFGHNDQSKHKVDRYTAPVEFKKNLTLFINQTKNKNATPILMTPITRRYFSEDGKIKDTHPIYADLVKEVANETKVTFIDMEKVTQAYFQALGDEQSALRFMHIKANLHPNYPNGIKDNTHLNALGAREVAQLVLAELRKINHSLIKVLRTPDAKHLKYSY